MVLGVWLVASWAAALAWGFAPMAARPVAPRVVCHDSDPTKVWYADVANGIQNLLTNSPLNEGKKAVVKLLAGPYDQEATRAKLTGLVDETPVLMLSFTK